MRKCAFSYFALISIFSILTCLSVSADDTWINPSGKPVADERNIKSKDGFGVQFWFITDKSFFEEWKKTDAYSKEHPVHVPAVNETTRMKELFPVVLLSWSEALAGEPCDVTYHLVVKKPDGSIYGDEPDLEGCKGLQISPGKIFMAPDHIGITIEPQDPLGEYSVIVAVKDHNSGTEIELSDKFSVHENSRGGASPAYPVNSNEFEK